MKKAIGTFFLISALFSLSSCMDDGNKLRYVFRYEPLIAGDTLGGATILSHYTTFRVSDFPENVKPGDYMISHFELYDENQEKDKLLKVSNFTAKKIGGTVISEEGSETYVNPVNSIQLFNEHVDSVLFIAFEHKGIKEEKYAYQMRYEHLLPEESKEEFILYIESKIINEAEGEKEILVNYYGFDMRPFIRYYREINPDEERLKFEIRYLSGFDSEGKRIYDTYIHDKKTKDKVITWKPEQTSARTFRF